MNIDLSSLKNMNGEINEPTIWSNLIPLKEPLNEYDSSIYTSVYYKQMVKDLPILDSPLWESALINVAVELENCRHNDYGLVHMDSSELIDYNEIELNEIFSHFTGEPLKNLMFLNDNEGKNNFIKAEGVDIRFELLCSLCEGLITKEYNLLIDFILGILRKYNEEKWLTLYGYDPNDDDDEGSYKEDYLNTLNSFLS